MISSLPKVFITPTHKHLDYYFETPQFHKPLLILSLSSISLSNSFFIDIRPPKKTIESVFDPLFEFKMKKCIFDSFGNGESLRRL